MIQLIHWFTKNHNYENRETMSMLDTFMVVDEIFVFISKCKFLNLGRIDHRSKCIDSRF